MDPVNTDYGDFDVYQNVAETFAIYPESEEIIYPTLGLVNEAGEVAGKVKKWLRGDYEISDKRDALIAELGDVLWYLAVLAAELDIRLSDVAAANLYKLNSRRSRGVIKGNGDDR